MIFYISDDSDLTASSVNDFGEHWGSASVDGFGGETKVSASVDGFGGFSLGVTLVSSHLSKSSGLASSLFLKRLKGSGRSESGMSSGCASHAEVTVAPTCFEAGWSFPQTEFGDVSTLHL